MMVVGWLASALAAEEADFAAYLDQRLEVVQRDVSTVYARDYDGSGRFWFVVGGDGVPLDAVDFATRVGDPAVAQDLQRQRRGRTAAGILVLSLGIAATGVTAVAAPVGVVNGTEVPVPALLTGVGVGAIGVVGGPLLLSGRLRLRHPASAYSEAEATERCQQHNAAVRDTLFGAETP